MRIGRKAEWLVGDGKAWIDTLVKFEYQPFHIYGKNEADGKAEYYCGVYGFGFFWDDNNHALSLTHTDSAKTYYVVTSEADVSYDGETVSINGSLYKGYTRRDIKNTFALFLINGDNRSYLKFNGSIKFFEINNISLTPLVLTSSLPAYLASDNLPHAAGECGMWDSVNEKFYGNANTSGAFSVENELDEYVEVDLTGICINGKYQRVSVENTEIQQIVWNGVNARMLMLNGKVVWSDGILIGERYQYLAFKANLTSTDICEIPTIIDWPRYFRLQIKHSWNQQQYVTLWKAGNFSLFKPSNAYMLYYPNKSNTGQFAISGQLDFDCVINNEDGTCEGHVGSKQLNVANFGSVSGRLSLMIKADSWRNSGQVGECILTDLDTNEVKHHFIPCVLSIDIDENLSLLNTPHQQGTIGMWDIVTKKFTTNSKGFDVLVARNKQGFITK